MLRRILEAIDRIAGFPEVSAHCDVPCGIYDPHGMQVAAHTVLRMIDLMGSTQDAHRIARYALVKGEHAEKVKHEARVIWGDYFKPAHLEKFPELHELTWKIMKLASQARQGTDREAAEGLLEAVLEFSEKFWETKGVKTRRIKAPYPTGGELVVIE